MAAEHSGCRVCRGSACEGNQLRFESVSELLEWYNTQRTDRVESGQSGASVPGDTGRRRVDTLPRGAAMCHDMAGNYKSDRFYSVTRGMASLDQIPLLWRSSKQDNNPAQFGFLSWHSLSKAIYFSHKRVATPPVQWIQACRRMGDVYGIYIPLYGTFITEWESGEHEHDVLFSSPDRVRECAAALQKLRTVSAHKFAGWFVNLESRVLQEHLPMLHKFLLELAQGNDDRGVTSPVVQGEEGLDSPTVAADNDGGATAFPVLWYDSVCADNGELLWQNAITERNVSFAIDTGNIFLNYCWTTSAAASMCDATDPAATRPTLEASVAFCTTYEDPKIRNNIEITAGVDVWGRGAFGGGQWNTAEAVRAVASLMSPNSKVGIFGPGWTCETNGHMPTSSEGIGPHARSRVWPWLRSMRLWEGWNWAALLYDDRECQLAQSLKRSVLLPSDMSARIKRDAALVIFFSMDVALSSKLDRNCEEEEEKFTITLVIRGACDRSIVTSVRCSAYSFVTVEGWILCDHSEIPAQLVVSRSNVVQGFADAQPGLRVSNLSLVVIYAFDQGIVPALVDTELQRDDNDIANRRLPLPLLRVPCSSAFHSGGLFGGDTFVDLERESKPTLFRSGIPVTNDYPIDLAASWIHAIGAVDPLPVLWSLSSFWGFFCEIEGPRNGFAYCSSESAFEGAQSLLCQGFGDADSHVVIPLVALQLADTNRIAIEFMIQLPLEAPSIDIAIVFAPLIPRSCSKNANLAFWKDCGQRRCFLSTNDNTRWHPLCASFDRELLPEGSNCLMLGLDLRGHETCRSMLSCKVGRVVASDGVAPLTAEQPTLQNAVVRVSHAEVGFDLQISSRKAVKVRFIDVFIRWQTRNSGSAELWLGRSLSDPSDSRFCLRWEDLPLELRQIMINEQRTSDLALLIKPIGFLWEDGRPVLVPWQDIVRESVASKE